jgi:hypothetical protein
VPIRVQRTRTKGGAPTGETSFTLKYCFRKSAGEGKRVSPGRILDVPLRRLEAIFGIELTEHPLIAAPKPLPVAVPRPDRDWFEDRRRESRARRWQRTAVSA